MKQASHSDDARVERVLATGLCDRDVSLAFRSHVAMAKLICQTSLASVALIDGEKVNFLSHNFPAALDVSELPREQSLCQHVLPSGSPQIVSDLREDLRFADHVFVRNAPHFVFWAGFPLIDDAGFTLGSLSVADFQPMTLDQRSIDLMRGLARQVTRHLLVMRDALPDVRPRLATLLHGLAIAAPTLRLTEAEAFVRLCSGSLPDPQMTQALVAARLVQTDGKGTPKLSPRGEEIRAELHLDAPLMRRKGSRILHPDQVSYYLDQLAASGNAA
jgi:hypothetical protein